MNKDVEIVRMRVTCGDRALWLSIQVEGLDAARAALLGVASASPTTMPTVKFSRPPEDYDPAHPELYAGRVFTSDVAEEVSEETFEHYLGMTAYARPIWSAT